MVAVLVIGLLLVGLAAALVARGLLIPRVQTAEMVGQVRSYGFRARRARRPTERRLTVRVAVDSAAASVGGWLAGHAGSEQLLRQRLMAAGLYTLPPRRLVGYQTLAALGLTALWLWASLTLGVASLLVVVGAIASLLAGWSIPVLVVKRRAQSRAQRVDREMPELIDLLVTTVEAGIAFSGSLQIAAQRFQGPLGEELRLTLQEQNMGLGLNEALGHLLERCDTPAVRSFVRSIVQGETLGVSIGQTLRGLAVDMRKRRRQMAEQRAHEAPIKMLFPLAFLIFPALFLILLGPSVMRMMDTF